MTRKLYSIIFQKEIVEDIELDLVKANLANLFKTTPATIGKMFEQDSIVIKRGLSIEHAEKYREAVKKAGALVHLKLEELEAEVEGSVDEDSKSGPEEIKAQIIDSWTNIVDVQEFVSAEFDTSDYSMAQPGERLVPENIVDSPSYKFEGMVLAPTGERLVEAPAFVPAIFRTDSLTLEEKD